MWDKYISHATFYTIFFSRKYHNNVLHFHQPFLQFLGSRSNLFLLGKVPLVFCRAEYCRHGHHLFCILTPQLSNGDLPLHPFFFFLRVSCIFSFFLVWWKSILEKKVYSIHIYCGMFYVRISWCIFTRNIVIFEVANVVVVYFVIFAPLLFCKKYK